MGREDVPLADGGYIRRQRKAKFGTVAEIPNRSQAMERLATLMRQKPTMQMTFANLVERWKAVVVPTIRDTTAANYSYSLDKYLVPHSGIVRFLH